MPTSLSSRSPLSVAIAIAALPTLGLLAVGPVPGWGLFGLLGVVPLAFVTLGTHPRTITTWFWDLGDP